MGAWGHGPFENDGAYDYLASLRDIGTAAAPDALRQTLTAFLAPSQMVSSKSADQAVAAAALIALRAGADASVSGTVEDFLDSHPFAWDEEMRTLAAKAFTHALEAENNEWLEVWEDQAHKVAAALEPFRQAVADPT
ncbi:DUF4259 domain-containing protein [Actinomadura sp. 6N118]|uniref:DUF4259 domain-containing protein n=1 Tax=Actinomadura sp. 6N118 TaxID=3375151 RepID=UPI003789946D